MTSDLLTRQTTGCVRTAARAALELAARAVDDAAPLPQLRDARALRSPAQAEAALSRHVVLLAARRVRAGQPAAQLLPRAADGAPAARDGPETAGPRFRRSATVLTWTINLMVYP